ncbi:hypothetical protein FXW04_10835 [Staphylococcus pseudintermedius]|nr:hypothetical protein [Staphylococcus pseudintermedius]
MSKWIEKNNEIMRRDSMGQLSLHKDKEAIELYLQHVDSKTKKFTNELSLLLRHRQSCSLVTPVHE